MVDLPEKKVIELVDDGRIIPIPRQKHNYDTPGLGEPRTTLKPLSIKQPEGPSFNIDGWYVSWQNWIFRVGFTLGDGLVLHQLSWDDGKNVRSIVYRANVTEMCVPIPIRARTTGTTDRYWKVTNPNVKNAVGANLDYKLIVNDSRLMLADERSKVRQRGGFATRHVWVTPFDPAERYASGDYPNQHSGGAGLPRYIEAKRNVENKDLASWHSFDHTHVCKPEDFPIMPVEYAGFMLKPNNVFSANPTMDLPSGRDQSSVEDSKSIDHGCCKL
ncbi:Copper amine oxidase, enzyme domain [Burkholderia sp. GAS332]|uniref:copper amine oxidase n=1 Tax=Paraburkholderia sp. TaxID=1926495 RepID=UPI0009285E78|nr:Copper amine oxidase, enzyme domain [Burkholderia sp. GAS332]